MKLAMSRFKVFHVDNYKMRSVKCKTVCIHMPSSTIFYFVNVFV